MVKPLNVKDHVTVSIHFGNWARVKLCAVLAVACAGCRTQVHRRCAWLWDGKTVRVYNDIARLCPGRLPVSLLVTALLGADRVPVTGCRVKFVDEVMGRGQQRSRQERQEGEATATDNAVKRTYTAGMRLAGILSHRGGILPGIGIPALTVLFSSTF